MAAERTPSCCSRRSALQLSVAALVLLGTSACRVRFENDAPNIPLIHHRAPMADEAALRAALVTTWSLADLARALPGSSRGVAARRVAVYGYQAAILADVLEQGGASLPARRPAAPLNGSSPSSTLRDAERSSLSAGLAGSAGLAAVHLPLMVSLLSQRATAAVQDGATVRWNPPSAAGTAAVSLLASARAASYGLEVVAAQIDTAHRALALATLGELRQRTATLQQLAGSAAGAPPLGYPLPWPVDSTASATRLAKHVLVTSSQDLAASAPAARGNAAALATLVRWIAEDEVAVAQWGSSTGAFPGLVLP